MKISCAYLSVTLILSLSWFFCYGANITYREISEEYGKVKESQIKTYFKDVSDHQNGRRPFNKRDIVKENARQRRSTLLENTTVLTTKAPVSSTAVPQNKTITSDHKYYTSQFVSDSNAYFKDIKALYDAGDRNVTMKKMTLPGSVGSLLMLYTTYKLKFVFPFYGHDVENVVVTSAGFLHIGPVVHSFAHNVHYAAPLMADFAASSDKPVYVYLHDDGARFIAQWDNIHEARKNNSSPFTFQVSLFDNGTIIFSYKSIPYSVVNFTSVGFHSKVGLSDGFVKIRYYRIPGTNLHIPFRIIYRYHKVELEQDRIKANSSYILQPIPNCIQAKSCQSCFSKEIAKNFQCKWCSKLNLCSDTFDWHRQKWENNDCPKNALDSTAKCFSHGTGVPATTATNPSTGDLSHAISEEESNKEAKRKTGIAIGVIIGILVIAVAATLFYGYRNPTSRLGLFMIQNRPTKLFSKF